MTLGHLRLNLLQVLLGFEEAKSMFLRSVLQSLH